MITKFSKNYYCKYVCLHRTLIETCSPLYTKLHVQTSHRCPLKREQRVQLKLSVIIVRACGIKPRERLRRYWKLRGHGLQFCIIRNSHLTAYIHIEQQHCLCSIIRRWCYLVQKQSAETRIINIH